VLARECEKHVPRFCHTLPNNRNSAAIPSAGGRGLRRPEPAITTRPGFRGEEGGGESLDGERGSAAAELRRQRANGRI